MTEAKKNGPKPDPQNKLSWSTSGSVAKNLPYLVEAHAPLLQDSSVKNVLEIASGFGDHIMAYADCAPNVNFQPTEYDDYLVHEINTKLSSRTKQQNIRPAYRFNLLSDTDSIAIAGLQEAPYDLVTATNLLNVSPWSVTQALFSRCTDKQHPLLAAGGTLAIYCCLKQGDRFMSEADEKFDAELKSRSPDFGIRNLEDVVKVATSHGLELNSKEALAGGTNLFLTFKRQR